MKTVVIMSHPNLVDSRLNKALYNAALGIESVSVRHIEALYGYDTRAIDVGNESEIIKNAERIVFQFPMFWLSTPPMMKAYIDAVFTHCHQAGLLEGKQLQIAVTTGSPSSEYSKHGHISFTINEILTPLSVAADYCSMTFGRIFVAGGAIDMSDEETAAHAQRYAKLLVDELEEEEYQA